MDSRRGAFIVIEGLDRSGKSTQAATLVQRLQSSHIPAKLHKFPDRSTPIGKMIDSYLRSESDLDDHVVHLLFSANRWELASSMEQTLKSGTYIICDRYAFSGIAFTASKPSQIPYEWCRTPDISLPAPDLTLYLDISPETAKERGGYGEERYEKEELQRRVREMFHRMRNETMTASSGDQDSSTDATDALRWVEIDAGGTMEDVTKAIWDHVEPLIQPGGIMKPISRLWMNHLSSPDSLNKELQKQQ